VQGSVFGAVTFLFLYEISRGTIEQICTKLTEKTCLVPCSDKFECQGHQGQKQLFSALSAACVWFMFGKTFLASSFDIIYLAVELCWNMKIAKTFK